MTTMSERPNGSALALVRDWLGPLEGRIILDVGCGMGGLARDLVAEGARVAGVDPSPAAVEAARKAAPAARFETAGGEDLPFDENAFDLVIFSNSLHHVPRHHMRAALSEALRVGRGRVLVIEPLAEGPFFETMRPIEDETEIRAAALDAIAETVAAGEARIERAREYDDVRRFATVEAFLEKVFSSDPSRAEAAKAVAGEVERLFKRWGTPEDGTTRLDQPHTAFLLSR